MTPAEHRAKMQARLLDAMKRELADMDYAIEAETKRLERLRSRRAELAARIEARSGGEPPS